MKRRRSHANDLKPEVIPDHIMMEILSRLSVRDIYTCRRVCKTWLSLVSHPHFPKLHEKTKPVAYLGLTKIPDYTVASHDFYLMEFINSSPKENKFEIINLKFRAPFKNMARHRMVSNHCHGFFCMYERFNWKHSYWKHSYWEHSYVCNPVLNEYVPIPQISRDSYRIGRILIGFDPVTNTYKLLRFLIHVDDRKNLVAEVLVLGDGGDVSGNADPWINIGNNKGDDIISLFSFCENTYGLSGPFLNGNFHQVISKLEDGFDSFDSICTFDFTSHRFKILPPPLDFNQESDDDDDDQTMAITINDMRIFTLDDFLCIGLALDQKQLFQVWAMKEYGVRESWTKLLAIETYLRSQPIAFKRNGELLLTWQTFDILASCVKHREAHDSNFFSTERETVPRYNLKSLFGEESYTPSFVSLKFVAGRYYQDVERGRRVRIYKKRAHDARCSGLHFKKKKKRKARG